MEASAAYRRSRRRGAAPVEVEEMESSHSPIGSPHLGGGAPSSFATASTSSIGSSPPSTLDKPIVLNSPIADEGGDNKKNLPAGEEHEHHHHHHHHHHSAAAGGEIPTSVVVLNDSDMVPVERTPSNNNNNKSEVLPASALPSSVLLTESAMLTRRRGVISPESVHQVLQQQQQQRRGSVASASTGGGGERRGTGSCSPSHSNRSSPSNHSLAAAGGEGGLWATMMGLGGNNNNNNSGIGRSKSSPSNRRSSLDQQQQQQQQLYRTASPNTKSKRDDADSDDERDDGIEKSKVKKTFRSASRFLRRRVFSIFSALFARISLFVSEFSPLIFDLMEGGADRFSEFWNEHCDYPRPTMRVAAIAFLASTLIHVIVTQDAISDMHEDFQRLSVLNNRLLEENAVLRSALAHKNLSAPGISSDSSSSSLGEEMKDDDNSLSDGPPLFALLCTVAVYGAMGGLLFREVRKARPQVKKNHTTWTEFLAYRVDYYFSSSVSAKPVLLLGLTVLLVVTGAILFYVVSDEKFGGSMWISWTFVSSPGSHAGVEAPLARIVSLFISLGGMLIFALVIGIVADSISDRVDSLKKGRSRVIENGHTLILGWSDKTLPVISELCEANRSEGGLPIVVLAEQDKQEMEERIRALDLKGSTVIVRGGSPISQVDLNKVSATTARSIIILSESAEDADSQDAKVVRIVLSVTGLGEKRGHCVVEMCDVDNKELVKLVGGDDVEIMVTHDIIGRLMIQSARQPGLAQVLEALLGFEGSEFYLKEWPDLFGSTMREIAFRFNDAVLLGVRPVNGKPILNPDLDRVYEFGEELLVLAEDDDSYELNERAPESLGTELPTDVVLRKGVETMLFCGWRRDMGDMIAELDNSVQKGSALWIISHVPVDERDARMEEDGRKGVRAIKNLHLVHRQGNPTLRRDLESLPLETFDSVLILADEEADMQSADSRSLATLLLIRDIQRERMQRLHPEQEQLRSPLLHEIASDSDSSHHHSPHLGTFINRRNSVMSSSTTLLQGVSSLDSAEGMAETKAALLASSELDDRCVLISEVLDPRTRSLISVANVSDFVMSNEIISAAIAQVSEQREINSVLQELLSAEGNETYVRDARLYAHLPAELSFWDMAAQAQKRKEIAIGYKRVDDDQATLNPLNKMEKIHWQIGDALIVIAED